MIHKNEVFKKKKKMFSCVSWKMSFFHPITSFLQCLEKLLDREYIKFFLDTYFIIKNSNNF